MRLSLSSNPALAGVTSPLYSSSEGADMKLIERSRNLSVNARFQKLTSAHDTGTVSVEIQICSVGTDPTVNSVGVGTAGTMLGTVRKPENILSIVSRAEFKNRSQRNDLGTVNTCEF